MAENRVYTVLDTTLISEAAGARAKASIRSKGTPNQAGAQYAKLVFKSKGGKYPRVVVLSRAGTAHRLAVKKTGPSSFTAVTTSTRCLDKYDKYQKMCVTRISNLQRQLTNAKKRKTASTRALAVKQTALAKAQERKKDSNPQSKAHYNAVISVESWKAKIARGKTTLKNIDASIKKLDREINSLKTKRTKAVAKKTPAKKTVSKRVTRSMSNRVAAGGYESEYESDTDYEYDDDGYSYEPDFF
ncbi:unknown [Feldmannia species virus]|uniref:Uncharacterized protein n=1 Tax=Feldmannia species virus TaxID=39420 RepID=B5LWD0_9PHYC|nr:hypothetical protein FeldSpV_gp041 [Feldmannia species virus]ACH46793.1 unknown [Feldmannia species virus]